MFDYSKCMNRMIFCIDLCSFFASCACVMRGLDPLKVKLAVVGDVNRKGSIVLAATPELKKLGVSTATRLTQLMSEIEALYSKIKKELKERPVHLDESKPELTQLRQLIEQAKERKLTSEFYEYDILTYKSFLECDLVEFRSTDRELVSNYLMDLKPIIPIYKNIIQNVNDSEYDVFKKLHMCS
ncbi:hypothetical protein PDM89_27845 [Bacillus cereus]|nr:hypothetical protein [Bacillus cereus]